MKIYESAENYLETILKLHRKNGAVRSIDIVNELGYSKPSVSVAMKKLREGGQILMDADGYISLTQSGLEVASRVYTRHQILTGFFVALGVDESVAAEDACKIEHDISEQTFGKIREFLEKKG